MSKNPPYKPLSKNELNDMLLRIRDFALTKAMQFVDSDDPTRKVLDETRATRLQSLVSTADIANQMLDDLT